MQRRTFVLLLAFCSPPGRAQSPCDTEVESKAERNDDFRYRERKKGELCEGSYLQKVASTFGGLWIASLTANRTPISEWPAALPLEWRTYGSDTVRIRAFPLRPRTYYRADIVLPAGSSSYRWNTDLIRNRLSPSEVGLVASTAATVDRRQQAVYLPVSSPKLPPSETTRRYKLIVIPPVELREVFLTVADNANRAKPLRDHVALRYGSYPANQRIEIDLLLCATGHILDTLAWILA